MSLHRTILWHLLNSPMSLAELQSVTQVSLPTLNRAVRSLLNTHWIRNVGQAEANGGRPAMLFGIDKSFYMIIGLHLQLPGIRWITTDLTGSVIDETKKFHGEVPSPSESMVAIADYITHIRATHPDQALLGIGIAAPGYIDLSTGDIISIGRVPTWENFPICRQLQAIGDVPVKIANDVDCMAFAEFQHINRPLETNLIYVGFDEGVKVSLFLKGELYKSSLGNAGLIASHLLYACEELDTQQIKELLTIVGVNEILTRRIRELDIEKQAPYVDLLAIKNPRERFRSILNSDFTEMPICQEIVWDLFRVISSAIDNVIHLIQPDVVVVGGLLSSIPKTLFPDLETAIRKNLPMLISNNTVIQQGGLTSQNSAAIGAIQHFLQSYLTDNSTGLASYL